MEVWGRSVRSELRQLHLAPLHNPSDPEKVLGSASDREGAQGLVRLFKKLPPRSRIGAVPSGLLQRLPAGCSSPAGFVFTQSPYHYGAARDLPAHPGSADGPPCRGDYSLMEPSWSNPESGCPVPATHLAYIEAIVQIGYMCEHYHVPRLFLTDLNAALQALRNITFRLQNEKARNPRL